VGWIVTSQNKDINSIIDISSSEFITAVSQDFQSLHKKVHRGRQPRGIHQLNGSNL
jgi:hypothetical protein